MIKLLFAMILFFSLVAPAGAEVATPDDCNTRDIPDCTIVDFEGNNDDGEPVYIVTQRLGIEYDESEIMSDDFILDYIDSLNENGEVFDIEGDGTKSFVKFVGPDYLEEASSYRMVIGSSDIHGMEQDSFFFIAYAHEYTYIFVIVGTHTSVLEYIEEVVNNDDLTVVPEDLVEIEPLDKKSI